MPVAAQGPFALDAAKLKLSSANALVLDASSDIAIYSKAAQEVTPIASLTKLMTAMVTLDANQPMDERISVRPRSPVTIQAARRRSSPP